MLNKIINNEFLTNLRVALNFLSSIVIYNYIITITTIDFDGWLYGSLKIIGLFYFIYLGLVLDQKFIKSDEIYHINGPFYGYLFYGIFCILICNFIILGLVSNISFSFLEFTQFNNNTKSLLFVIWLLLLYPISLLGQNLAESKNNLILSRLRLNESLI